MKFIMLINVKMPTNIDILPLISRINTTSESLKARKVFNFRHFSFYDSSNFMLCSFELSMKHVITSGPTTDKIEKLGV